MNEPIPTILRFDAHGKPWLELPGAATWPPLCLLLTEGTMIRLAQVSHQCVMQPHSSLMLTLPDTHGWHRELLLRQCGVGCYKPEGWLGEHHVGRGKWRPLEDPEEEF